MAEVMAELAVMVGMPPEDMPPAMRRLDTLVSVLAAEVLSILREPPVDTRAMQDAQVIGMVAATGEAVIGEAVTGIHHPMDIPGLAITAWAMAIHTTVTAMAGTMVRTTTDITLTATDTGRR
jgi:hypothetical protein